ncbi:DUF6538 domain-containing protein, partial [Yoonia sp. 208BN28-4]|uniref:DUF6538 domain-containing protein n=1 Tax=Yoonia sp. 208BN28-4 TaxID=3126505 RepID=UPI0030A1AD00
MSSKIKYAYLHGQVWIYRRNYPKDVQTILGSQALKQSLKTSDPRVARQRVVEVNDRFEATVSAVRSGGGENTTEPYSWLAQGVAAIDRLRATLCHLEAPQFNLQERVAPTIAQLADQYLGQRSNQLRPGGYKSVRYSVSLFASKFGNVAVDRVTRDHGLDFLACLPRLSTLVGKDDRSSGQSLDWLLEFSKSRPKITARTQRRIWSQVNHFINWSVYQGI